MKPARSEKNAVVCEAALCLSAALALSYLEIPLPLLYGGSIDFVMLPIILLAMRRGAGWGVGAGFSFGILKYLLTAGFAANWISILLDYSVAYAMVGLAGVFHGRYRLLPLGALLGCAGRFVIHYISGVTVYAAYMPESFLTLTMTTPYFYSLLYNALYMLPNTVIAVLLCALLRPAVARLPVAK